ncbi:MAG: alpha/beta hydrolase-fold protein [Sorangiineae bacterium]|nr:alpha/beta hydrolase-fold protein [Polyangiaceae bacterium]MEB2321379.1 alpha/beta hydrolase-fold protein [Sorangiineae bacterium]
MAAASTTPSAWALPARLAPAPDGTLGAWLLAGPIPKTDQQRLDLAAVTPARDARAAEGDRAPRWRLAVERDGALDLARTLGTRPRSGALALLGGELHLERPRAVYLLLSADGGATVYLDGSPVWSRSIERLRGRSWDPIPLSLAAGSHRLVIALTDLREYWAVAARLVDERDLLAPEGLSVVLPGTDDADTTTLARALASLELSAGLTSAGYAPSATFAFPAGAPLGVPFDVSVTLTAPGRDSRTLHAGASPIGPRGAGTLEVALPALELPQGSPPGPLEARLELTLGPARAASRLSLDPRAPETLARAERLLAALPAARFVDPTALSVTLQAGAAEVRALGAAPRAAPGTLRAAVERLRALVEKVERGVDPLLEPGVHDLAIPSPIDGEPARMRVHVPAGFAPSAARRYPLVVALHGLNGEPAGVMNAFLDSRSLTPRAGVDGFVLAPHAHGNAFYRDSGEAEVMHALDWALRTYPIDEARVSITGVSMGGTGAAGLAFLYADRFSAAAPLCGYQSYFIRRDTSNRPLRPWERARMAHWSPTSWADNGRNLPLYLAQGTKDWPLENGKVLVRRYRELGYSIVDEWPDIGHHVWEIVWKDAKGWPWLARQRRDPSPARITLVSDQLRYGRQGWLSITMLAAPGQMGRVDARRASERALELTTDGVTGVAVDRSGARLDAAATLAVTIDGQRLELPPGAEPAFHREDSGWAAGVRTPPPGAKRAEVEGPIRDAFLGPLVFVYGSLDPGTARANREVARAFARRRPGLDVRYEIIADRELDRARTARASLFLVGTARDNLALRELDAELPVRVHGGALALGAHRYSGEEVGAIFIAPNPRNPDRYVIAIEATSVRGIWRALSLPELLPDFVVYDERVAGAAAEQVLGKHASVLAGGFFNADWSVPNDVADPVAAR